MSQPCLNYHYGITQQKGQSQARAHENMQVMFNWDLDSFQGLILTLQALCSCNSFHSSTQVSFKLCSKRKCKLSRWFSSSQHVDPQLKQCYNFKPVPMHGRNHNFAWQTNVSYCSKLPSMQNMYQGIQPTPQGSTHNDK